MQTRKTCCTCRKRKPLSEFTFDKTCPDGYYRSCRVCKRAAQKRSQEKHKQARIENEADWTQKRADLRRHYNTLLGNVCARCGYNEFEPVLAMHHVDPEAKGIAIAAMIARKAACASSKIVTDQFVTNELDKCALLCNNCHMAYHAGLWVGEWVRRSPLGWSLGA